MITLFLGALALSSCEQDDGSQDLIDQELRFFDIYLQSNYPDASPTESGLYFIEEQAGTGAQAGEEDWVLINHVAYILPEERVYDSYVENVAMDNRIHLGEAPLYGPYKVRNGAFNKGFTEGLSLMNEGGKATFMFSSELGYGASASKVPAYSSLKYEVELLEVLGDSIEEYEEEQLHAYGTAIPGSDTIYNTDLDATMYYVIDRENFLGDSVLVDSTVQVKYKGYLRDGRVFDETVDDNYLSVEIVEDLDDAEVIAGWILGLQKFKTGEKGRLVIPYQMAYGVAGRTTSSGFVTIPPYETLIFDIEVIDPDIGVPIEDPL